MANVARLRAALLEWHDSQARRLPWRRQPGQGADPYRVWLSEVMLQQTTVAHAMPYFLEFIRRWPTVTDLAAAEDAEVMAAWAGLGYYARARNLLACARTVAGERRGAFPDSEEGLRRLPGVGDYTAAAIAAIAFDRPATVADSNVERVIARLHAVETPLPQAKAELHVLAAALTPGDRPGDWAQAMMDLGQTLCRPRAPHCDRCPIGEFCCARSGAPAEYPRRAAKPERPRRFGVAYAALCDGAVGLERRPPNGLLGGMLGLPTTSWRANRWTVAEARAAAPILCDWRQVGEIEHGFTHFALSLTLWRAAVPERDPGLIWKPLTEAIALTPTAFAKALRRL